MENELQYNTNYTGNGSERTNSVVVVVGSTGSPTFSLSTGSPTSSLSSATSAPTQATVSPFALHRVSIVDDRVVVVYSKNFDTCAHLYRSDGITHKGNFFCTKGSRVVKTVDLADMTNRAGRVLSVGDEVWLRHGAKY